jgi:hypothetical protein
MKNNVTTRAFLMAMLAGAFWLVIMIPVRAQDASNLDAVLDDLGTEAVSESSSSAQPVVSDDSDSTFKVLKLNHANAINMAKQLSHFYPYDKITADERTNSLLVRGDQGFIKAVEEILKELDVPSFNEAAHVVTRDGNTHLMVHAPTTAPGKYSQPEQQLRNMAEYAYTEEQAMMVANQYRTIAQDVTNDEEKELLAQMKKKLAKLVAAAFQQRQNLQMTEVQQLRERLNNLETQINEREQNRQAIINQRLEELIKSDPEASL